MVTVSVMVRTLVFVLLVEVGVEIEKIVMIRYSKRNLREMIGKKIR